MSEEVKEKSTPQFCIDDRILFLVETNSTEKKQLRDRPAEQEQEQEHIRILEGCVERISQRYVRVKIDKLMDGDTAVYQSWKRSPPRPILRFDPDTNRILLPTQLSGDHLVAVRRKNGKTATIVPKDTWTPPDQKTRECIRPADTVEMLLQGSGIQPSNNTSFPFATVSTKVSSIAHTTFRVRYTHPSTKKECSEWIPYQSLRIWAVEPLSICSQPDTVSPKWQFQ